MIVILREIGRGILHTTDVFRVPLSERLRLPRLRNDDNLGPILQMDALRQLDGVVLHCGRDTHAPKILVT
jgi:hypothetical protein